MKHLHKVCLSLLIAANVGGLVIVSAKQNYEQALKVTTWGDNSDSSNREIMQAYGFKNATGCEQTDPALPVMVASYFRFIFN